MHSVWVLVQCEGLGPSKRVLVQHIVWVSVQHKTAQYRGLGPIKKIEKNIPLEGMKRNNSLSSQKETLKCRKNESPKESLIVAKSNILLGYPRQY